MKKAKKQQRKEIFYLINLHPIRKKENQFRDQDLIHLKYKQVVEKDITQDLGQ